MEPFQAFSSQYNPQIYESSNVPPSTDRLFSFSGFQAGLMTNQSANAQVPPLSLQRYQQLPVQQYQHMPLHQPQPTLSKPPTSSYQSPQALIPAPSAPTAPPPPGTSTSSNTQNDSGRYSGMYANTGFDMLSILSRVTNR
jgi:hypothetical protein